jgi:uncharacterized membrane-anchored protein
VSVSYKKRGEVWEWTLLLVAIALATCFDKIFGTLAEKSTFHHGSMVPNIIFGILAIFYFAMQNDKLKVTSIFI